MKRLLRRLLPPSRPPLPWKRVLPQGYFEWATALLLLVPFIIWIGYWIDGHWQVLVDPLRQTDDARTALQVFHRYDLPGAFPNDPVIDEMEGFTPPALRLLYRGILLFTDLFHAIKVVQALALLMIVAAGVHLLRRRRCGLSTAIVFLFLILHTRGFLSGTFGGMTRGFVVPVLALWSAGAISASERLRHLAIVLAALTHPSSMALALAGEGLMAVGAGLGRSWKLTRQRLLRFGALGLVCMSISLPYAMDQKSRVGPTFTVEEAIPEKILGPDGRAAHLPFGDPMRASLPRFVAPLLPGEESESLLPAAVAWWEGLEGTGAFLLIGIVSMLLAARLAPRVRPFLPLLAATAVTYTLARLFAFRFYAPARYYQYGMPFACLVFFSQGIGQILPGLRGPFRPAIRDLVAVVFLGALFLVTGNGIFPGNGASLDRRRDAPLFDWIEANLPLDAKIAAHPRDGDDIPFWTARSTVCGFETLQPWWKDHWKRGKERAQDTLHALYATDPQELFAYCRKYGVTHLLLAGHRYSNPQRLLEKAHVFEPLDSWTAGWLAGRRLQDLVAMRIPDEAIVFSHRSFRLVDVAKLERLLNS